MAVIESENGLVDRVVLCHDPILWCWAEWTIREEFSWASGSASFASPGIGAGEPFVQDVHGSVLDFSARGFRFEAGGAWLVLVKPLSILAVACLAGSAPALANRNFAPVLPPGQAGKVTRADFKEKEEKEAEREQRLEELEEKLEDSEDEREAKRLERLAIEAAREAERLAEAEKRAQAPEDFVGDATKVQMTEAPKAASVNETVVQQATVIAAAKKVVARRTR